MRSTACLQKAVTIRSYWPTIDVVLSWDRRHYVAVERRFTSMIEVSREVYDELVYRAYEGGDREVCGILAGTFDLERSVGREIHATDNVADKPQIRYEIDPEMQLTITEDIEARGLDVMGFYHSHPTGPPHPSATDAARATWPDFSYVIIALDGYPFVGSWRWQADEECFEQERISIGEIE